jgi:hypothetical protein
VSPETTDVRAQVADYCREIETYLCRKNDGHLIRVVGPSFEIVSKWAAGGIPIKVAYEGIDRYFERYYRQGARRRPVKIDFCEADVLDAFDQWRRATGISGGSPRSAHRETLPSHLERVVTRLTSVQASDSAGVNLNSLIDRLSVELDAARSKTGGLRGGPRADLITRLAAMDEEMLKMARDGTDRAKFVLIAREADDELGPFRAAMTKDAYERAREAAIDRLVRQRLNLPTIYFG